MMSIHSLETTELIREVNKEVSEGCLLEHSGESEVDRKTEKADSSRRRNELWQSLQMLHYQMRKRSFALFQNFMMTQQVMSGHPTKISNRVAEFFADICKDHIRIQVLIKKKEVKQ